MAVTELSPKGKRDSNTATSQTVKAASRVESSAQPRGREQHRCGPVAFEGPSIALDWPLNGQRFHDRDQHPVQHHSLSVVDEHRGLTARQQVQALVERIN